MEFTGNKSHKINKSRHCLYVGQSKEKFEEALSEWNLFYGEVRDGVSTDISASKQKLVVRN